MSDYGNTAAQAQPDERHTTRIVQRAQKHAAEINELVSGVEQLANALFGHLPPEPAAPTGANHAIGHIEPVKPQIDRIDSAQFRGPPIGTVEALESLRRQLARLSTL